MKTKHTPGPWEIDKEYPRRIQMEGTPENAPQTGAIAEVAKAYWKEGVMEANARLIAAAPDLLEACKDAKELIQIARQYFPKSVKNSDKFQLENTCATIGAAIAKVGLNEIERERMDDYGNKKSNNGMV